MVYLGLPSSLVIFHGYVSHNQRVVGHLAVLITQLSNAQWRECETSAGTSQPYENWRKQRWHLKLQQRKIHMMSAKHLLL